METKTHAHSKLDACAYLEHMDASPGPTHQNIHSSNHFLCFSMGLLCWQESVQYSKLTAARLNIIVKKLKPHEANGHKPHLRSQAVKTEPVKERKKSARERNQAHKSHSTVCIIMTWSHKCTANESLI